MNSAKKLTFYVNDAKQPGNDDGMIRLKGPRVRMPENTGLVRGE